MTVALHFFNGPLSILLVGAVLGTSTGFLACQTPPEENPQDDDGAEDDTTPFPDDDSSDPCQEGPTPETLLKGKSPLTAPSRAYSDSAHSLSVATAVKGDLSYQWEIGSGSLDDPHSPSPVWTVPNDFSGNHTSVSLSVTVTHPCAQASAQAEIAVVRRDADRVLIIANADVPEGVTLGQDYAAARGIPESRVVSVTAGTASSITVDQYRKSIRDPVRNHLKSQSLETQITTFVTVYGMPYHLEGLEPPPGYDIAWGWWPVSLDSMLGTLWMTDSPLYAYGLLVNPLYVLGDSPTLSYPELRRGVEVVAEKEFQFIPVARLDGPTPEDAWALVTRALEGEELARQGLLVGNACIDRQYPDDPATDDFGSYESVEWALRASALLLEGEGWPLILDTHGEEFGTDPAPLCPDALWYSGWYSYNNYPNAFTWAPGSIGIHFDSCSACSMKEGSNFALNAVLNGITATLGAVNEPFVFGLPDMDQVWWNLLGGNNLSESVWQSTAYVRWMTTLIGDPLYCPFDPDREP